MLRITVELIPFGMETYRTKLATFTITNEGKNKNDPNNYDYTLTSDYVDGNIPSQNIPDVSRQQGIPWFLKEVFEKARF